MYKEYLGYRVLKKTHIDRTFKDYFQSLKFRSLEFIMQLHIFNYINYN